MQHAGERAFDLACAAGAEQGVDHELGACERFVELRGIVIEYNNRQLALDEGPEVCIVFAAWVEQDNRHVGAPVLHVTGGDEPIAAVVAGACEHDNLAISELA